MKTHVKIEFDIGDQHDKLFRLTNKILKELESEFKGIKIDSLEVVYKLESDRGGHINIAEISKGWYRIYLDIQIANKLLMSRYDTTSEIKSTIIHEFKHLIDVIKLLDEKTNKLNKKFVNTVVKKSKNISKIIEKRISNLAWVPNNLKTQVINYFLFNNFLLHTTLEMRSYYEDSVKNVLSNKESLESMIMKEGLGVIDAIKDIYNHIIKSIKKDDKIDLKKIMRGAHGIGLYTAIVMGLVAKNDPGFRKEFNKFMKKPSVTNFIWLSQLSFQKYRGKSGIDHLLKVLLQKAPIGYKKDKSIIPVNDIRAKLLEQVSQELMINVKKEMQVEEEVINVEEELQAEENVIFVMD